MAGFPAIAVVLSMASDGGDLCVPEQVRPAGLTACPQLEEGFWHGGGGRDALAMESLGGGEPGKPSVDAILQAGESDGLVRSGAIR